VLLLVIALATTIFLILVIERLAKPRMRRPLIHRLSLLSVMPPVGFFVTMFMVSYRPIFSSLSALGVFLAIVIVNNAKYAILREPLVFSDFALLRQAIRYPALYIRYVGIGKVIGVVVGLTAIIVGAIWLEPPIIVRRNLNDYLPMALYLATTIGVIYSITRGPFRGAFSDLLRRFGPEVDLAQDMDQLTLVVSLILYFFVSLEPEYKAAPVTKATAIPARRAGQGCRHVVVVQSESFFDARALAPDIPKDLLSNWDRRAGEASFHGRLAVPAWGANTMRTEFSFLSGLPNEILGHHRFNPYLSSCKQPTWTIVQLFRMLGWRTVCVHPFHGSFFGRDDVIPNLGFDRFLDIKDFEGSPTYGPYVSDMAVAERICACLTEADSPCFVYAITMENHGNWEPDRLDGYPLDDRIPATPLGSRQLGLYLQHLRSTDRLIERVTGELERQEDGGVFCLFGDHLPPLGPVFDKAKMEDPRTDYLIWRKGDGHSQKFDTSVDALSRLVQYSAFGMAGYVPAPQLSAIGN
jgi:hypothetical protein